MTSQFYWVCTRTCTEHNMTTPHLYCRWKDSSFWENNRSLFIYRYCKIWYTRIFFCSSALTFLFVFEILNVDCWFYEIIENQVKWRNAVKFIATKDLQVGDQLQSQPHIRLPQFKFQNIRIQCTNGVQLWTRSPGIRVPQPRAEGRRTANELCNLASLLYTLCWRTPLRLWPRFGWSSAGRPQSPVC